MADVRVIAVFLMKNWGEKSEESSIEILKGIKEA